MPAKAINTICLTLICLVFMPLAQAHTGGGDTSGLAAGFMHPLTGLDHLLIALAAGYWAGMPGKRSGRGVLFFLTLLASGMLLGALFLAIPSPAITAGLAFFLAATILIAAVVVPSLFAHAFFGSFALYHGFAHLLEMPAAVAPAGYICGLLSATALLLTAGMALGQIKGMRHCVSDGRN